MHPFEPTPLDWRMLADALPEMIALSPLSARRGS
jgi:hypothetical protein